MGDITTTQDSRGEGLSLLSPKGRVPFNDRGRKWGGKLRQANEEEKSGASVNSKVPSWSW